MITIIGLTGTTNTE